MEKFFDSEKQKQALEWLNTKWKNKTCECCGLENWILSDQIVAQLGYEGNIVIGGPVSPHITVSCKNCGNTKYFNAVIIGIFQKESN